MSVNIHDGVLLGAIFSNEVRKEIVQKLGSDDEITVRTVYQALKKIITEENFPSYEDIGPVFFVNDPYNPQGASVYLGIFWRWGKRRAMQIDELWQPLFKEMQETLRPIWDEQNSRIRKKLFDYLKDIIPNFKFEDVKMYEVRFWS